MRSGHLCVKEFTPCDANINALAFRIIKASQHDYSNIHTGRETHRQNTKRISGRVDVHFALRRGNALEVIINGHIGIFCGMTYRDNERSWFESERTDWSRAQGKQRSITRGLTDGQDVIN